MHLMPNHMQLSDVWTYIIGEGKHRKQRGIHTGFTEFIVFIFIVEVC